MGAWIETLQERCCLYLFLSHPVWVRGLKQTGRFNNIPMPESHPVWVRGLKRY